MKCFNPTSSSTSRPRAGTLTAKAAAFGIVLFLMLALTGCQSQESETPPALLYTFQGTTMGTYYVVKLVQPAEQALDEAAQEELLALIDSKLEGVNQAMSTYLDDSELSRFNAAPAGEPFTLSEQTFEVFQAAAKLGETSLGALDVTVGPLVNAWGFGPSYDVPKDLDNELLEQLLQQIGWQHLTLDAEANTVTKAHDNVYCDLSSIAKGFAVDQALETLRDRGHQSVMVEIGGEVRAIGANLEGRAWRLGIESPVTTRGQLQRIIPLDDRALATSGDYRNYKERNGVRLSHLIDPRTGRPIDHRLASVSVVDRTCMRADGLSTALMILGPEQGLALADDQGLAALFLVREGDDFKEIPSRVFAELYMPGDGSDDISSTDAEGDAP